MNMSQHLKGYLYGCIAAVSYGVNPICAKYLYQDGYNSNSVLFYRFLFGSVMLGLLMLVQRKSFAITRREGKVLSLLGAVFAVSSLTYFLSFHYMSAGVAATLVFAYPVFTAMLMAFFFKERLKWPSLLAMLLTVGGIVLLYKDDSGRAIALMGIVLILVSALSYAIYIIVVNRSGIVMSSVKLTFYAMSSCFGVPHPLRPAHPHGRTANAAHAHAMGHGPHPRFGANGHIARVYGHGHTLHRLHPNGHNGCARAGNCRGAGHNAVWRGDDPAHSLWHNAYIAFGYHDYTRRQVAPCPGQCEGGKARKAHYKENKVALTP